MKIHWQVIVLISIPTLIGIYAIYVILKAKRAKKKRVKEHPLTKKIREFEKEYKRITEE